MEVTICIICHSFILLVVVLLYLRKRGDQAYGTNLAKDLMCACDQANKMSDSRENDLKGRPDELLFRR